MDRSEWVAALTRMAGPVLRGLATRTLKATMPVEGAGDPRHDRSHFTHLEALARTLVGIAPWLELQGLEGVEEAQRALHADLAVAALASAVDPDSPDYVNFSFSFQPIVDAAFLSQALLRAPRALLRALPEAVRLNLIAGLKATRTRKAHFNNWLLFAAMIEAGLRSLGSDDWDRARIDYALRQHEQWYKGDGVYGDGPDFHFDYYNSFVIQPMLLDIYAGLAGEEREWDALAPGVVRRAARYAEVQERLIAPDGSFPPLGRSLAYRCGAFQLLALLAATGRLPATLPPGQVRAGLTAVLRRCLDAPGTYDPAGWLTVGFCGHQPDIGEFYISTGSLYLASSIFLPLGLPAEAPFWVDAAIDWTAKRMWTPGAPAVLDHALDHDCV